MEYDIGIALACISWIVVFVILAVLFSYTE